MATMSTTSTTAQAASRWVRETRFGNWFVGTEVWRRYVLAPAIDELVALGGEPAAGLTILDVGCGEGLSFPMLAERLRPGRIIGVDIDPKLVAKAAAAGAALDVAVEVRRGDGAALDLPDASVDLIWCHQSFHHISAQAAAAAEFRRVLRPGGMLYFNESCRSFIWSLWVRVFFRHPMEVQKTAEEYAALLRAAGFAFGPDNLSTPYPPWSRPDFGLREWLTRDAGENRSTPLVCIAARRPG